jgi:hypothetical protein
VVTLQAGVGPGLHVDAKVTDFAAVGVGAARQEAWRIGERQVRNVPDVQAGLPVSLAAWIPAVGTGHLERAGVLHVDARSLVEERALRKLDLEAGASLGWVGVRAGFRAGELVDFLAGIVGLDPADDDGGNADERAFEAAGRGRWFGGDPHVHVSPPDRPGHVKLTLTETVRLARRRGLDWLFVTPHLFFAGRDEEGKEVVFGLEELTPALRALPPDGPVVVPGFEWSSRRGHLGVVFHEPGVDRMPFALRAEHAARNGAFVTVNHPFVAAIPIPVFGRKVGIPIGWKGPAGEVTRFDAVEGYNLLWDLGERLFLVPPDRRSLARAFQAADAAVAAGKRMVVTGSTDNHGDYLLPLTWVRAEPPLTAAKLHEALRAGRVCLVNDEARTFRARSDCEPAWCGIGESLRADRTVELRWRGRAELIADGRSLGVHRAGFVHRIDPGSPHAYRIVARGGYSNWVYVNRP